jgi:POT family proton-dependent oligopeptide transporter
MLLIPFNNLFLYPGLTKLGYTVTPLRKMTWGIVFSGFAWVAAGGLQFVLDGGDKISILWQILPYIILTFGEVLVSATGLEFAYSQAPLAMKGVIMSFWNLTTTVGNLWVLLADAGVRDFTVEGKRLGVEASMAAGATLEANVPSKVFHMFFFAGFAFAAGLAFKLYTRRYTMLDMYRTREQPKTSRDVVADKAAGAAALPEARDVSKKE